MSPMQGHLPSPEDQKLLCPFTWGASDSTGSRMCPHTVPRLCTRPANHQCLRSRRVGLWAMSWPRPQISDPRLHLPTEGQLLWLGQCTPALSSATPLAPGASTDLGTVPVPSRCGPHATPGPSALFSRKFTTRASTTVMDKVAYRSAQMNLCKTHTFSH